jgi:hypothetical protein
VCPAGGWAQKAAGHQVLCMHSQEVNMVCHPVGVVNARCVVCSLDPISCTHTHPSAPPRQEPHPPLTLGASHCLPAAAGQIVGCVLSSGMRCLVAGRPTRLSPHH